MLAGKPVHSVLDPKTEQRAIFGRASGIGTTVNRLPQDSRQGRRNTLAKIAPFGRWTPQKRGAFYLGR